MGVSSSKTKTTSQSTSTNAPTAQYAPYTDQAIGDVKKVYDDNQGLFSGLGGKALDVVNGLNPAASSLSNIYSGNGPGAATYNNLQHASANDTSVPILHQLAQQASNPDIGAIRAMVNGTANGDTDQYYKDVIGGKYLDNNPFIDRIAQEGSDAALKAVNQRYAASGMGEGMSTPYAQAAGGAISDANNTLRFNNYNAERGNQNAAAGLSDNMYNATKDRNLSAANSAANVSAQDRSSQLAAAQSLGNQNSSNNATSLGAANAQTQSILSALGLAPGMADEQLRGLSGASMMPFAGVSNYTNLINALTGKYQTVNSNSSGTTTSNPSLIDSVGKAVDVGTNLASLFSDRRLKTDIARIGTTDDGLGVYTYRYKWGGPVQMGVMADEVANVRPEALGPTVGGFATVNYGAL